MTMSTSGICHQMKHYWLVLGNVGCLQFLKLIFCVMIFRSEGGEREGILVIHIFFSRVGDGDGELNFESLPVPTYIEFLVPQAVQRTFNVGCCDIPNLCMDMAQFQIICDTLCIQNMVKYEFKSVQVDLSKPSIAIRIFFILS